MTDKVIEAFDYANISATATVHTGKGSVGGIFVASASATPTIKVTDGASQIIVNTFTPTAGTFYPMPGKYATSLKVTISGTVDCTVFFNANG